jgi:hypothetical protein
VKIVGSEIIIEAGVFPQTEQRQQRETDVANAIRAVEWPSGSGSFTIKPIKHGNGVKPIKDAWIHYLVSVGWHKELQFDLGIADLPIDAANVPDFSAQGGLSETKPGPMDAAFETSAGQYFCAEWETGNISSSHRALNKMALGILKGVLIGGILIVPSMKLYPHLTDRIGNIRELMPYLPLWKSLQIKEGLLKILIIEQDQENMNVDVISKGTDGRALR